MNLSVPRLMEKTDFSKPIRQSVKGIIVIFAFNVFSFFKKFFVLFLAFGVSLLRRKTFGNITLTMIWLGLTLLLVIFLIIAILKFINFKFHLNKDDFYLSTGIINKDHTIIPKSKIQNVYIQQNFLQQLIKVVSLKIETAGDKKSEIEISALDKPTALLLKKELFTKEKEDYQTETHIEERQIFFKVSPKRLLLEGLSQNHFKSFLLIVAFTFGLYNEFKDYLEELNLEENVEGFVNLDNASIFNLILTNLLIVLFIILISFSFSVIKTFILNFNLEVVEAKKTVEINKGIFNKVSLSLSPSRIQNIVVTTNRLKQYFGLHNLSVKQAMVNQKQQKNFNIVALEMEQLNYLLKKLLINYPEEVEIEKPRPYFMRISAIKVLFFGLIMNGAFLMLFETHMLWSNAIFVPLAVIYIYLAYKKAYYKISDNFVIIGSGVIDTTTSILEIHKIQDITLKQTIFQKRSAIASLVISTASESVTIPYISQSDAFFIYNILLYKVESQDKDWM